MKGRFDADTLFVDGTSANISVEEGELLDPTKTYEAEERLAMQAFFEGQNSARTLETRERYINVGNSGKVVRIIEAPTNIDDSVLHEMESGEILAHVTDVFSEVEDAA